MLVITEEKRRLIIMNWQTRPIWRVNRVEVYKKINSITNDLILRDFMRNIIFGTLGLKSRLEHSQFDVHYVSRIENAPLSTQQALLDARSERLLGTFLYDIHRQIANAHQFYQETHDFIHYKHNLASYIYWSKDLSHIYIGFAMPINSSAANRVDNNPVFILQVKLNYLSMSSTRFIVADFTDNNDDIIEAYSKGKLQRLRS